MSSFYLLICMLFVFELSHAQGTPAPIGGWDSLKKAIVYPNLAIRAGLNGMTLAKLWVDTTGHLINAEILWSDAEIFNEPVLNAVRSDRWPARLGWDKGRPFVVPVMFRLRGTEIKYEVLIEADAPLIAPHRTN